MVTGQGHFSEGSRSLGKVMSYSVAGSEISSPTASTRCPDKKHVATSSTIRDVYLQKKVLAQLLRSP